MRIRELRLIRYGKFTGRSLSLPWQARDLHLIVGPNEAGKSTVRSAISDWLFGMAMRTPWAFLHPMPELRLGGILERGALGAAPSESLSFDRTKGIKETVRSPADVALPDAVLQPWLGHWQASAFNRLHALDHTSLVQGGAGILSASDDVGRLLFQSAAGLQHLGDLLQQLRAEADALWGKRKAGARQYYQAHDAFEAAKTDFKQATLRAKDWAAQRQALQDTERALHQARQRDVQIRQRLHRLERLRRVRPLLQALDEAHARQQALGAPCPSLPPDAATTLHAVQQTLARLQAEQAHAQTLQAQMRAALDGLSVPQALLARADDITELNNRRLQFRAHRTDLVKRQDEVQHLAQQAQQLARALGWPDTHEAALRLRLPAASVCSRLQRLIEQHTQQQQDRQATERQQAEREQEARHLAQQLSQLPLGTVPPALLAALDQAEQLGDPTGQAADMQQRLHRLAARVDSARAALQQPGWPLPDVARLRALLVPDPAWVQSLLEQHRQDAVQVQALQATLTQKTEALQALDMALAQLVSQFQPVSWQQVQAARHDRNATWARICHTPHDLPALAGPFDAQLQQADQLADARLERAQHEADRQAKAEQRAQCALEQQQCASRLAALQQAMQQRLSDWQALTQRSGLPDVPLPLAPAWLQHRQQLLDALDEQAQALQQQAARHAAQAQARQQLWQQLQQAKAAVAAPVGSMVSAPDLADLPDWADCLRQARSHIRQQEQAQARRETLTQQAQAVRNSQNSLRLHQQAAQAAQARWAQAWQDLVQTAGYAADVQPDQVATELDTLAQLDKLLDRMQTLRIDRIEPMQADLDGLAASARALARELQAFLPPELQASQPPASPEQLALALAQQLVQAQQTQARVMELQQHLHTHEASLALNQQQQRAAYARLAPLFSVAGLPDSHDLQALADGVAQSDRQREVQQQLGAAQRALWDAADGLPTEELRQELASISADALEAERLQLSHEASTVVEEIATHSSRHGTLKTALDALSGNASAAEAEARRQEAIAAMGDAAERYLQLHTAARLLQWSMEKFRETQQGPMLAQASALFAGLTRGSFARLLVDSEPSTPRLLGIRPNGQAVEVSGMSEGSRDQLYLALRLAALALQSGQGGQASTPPLIADDLFINFDDERTAAGLQVLGEVSTRMQVLFLTHHEHLVPLARQVLGDELNVVYL